MSQPYQLRPDDDELYEHLMGSSDDSLGANDRPVSHATLQRILDSARSLADARYGVMTRHDETGRVQEFLYSGMTSQEARQFRNSPEARQLYEHLDKITDPLRVSNLAAYLEENGLTEFLSPFPTAPVIAFLAAPAEHRGQRVGNICLIEKHGRREFTRKDEELLTMLASYAGMAIIRSRRYRAEQRARTALDSILETLPVGVVIFDGETGLPVSANRETARIIGSLREPGQPLAEFLDALTYVRSDGQEVPIKGFRLSPATNIERAVLPGEDIPHVPGGRPEPSTSPVTLRVPNGRSISILRNATAVRSSAGDVKSVVITLQDMTPLEEMEFMRAEFLAMVSHELRTPLAAIKGSTTTLLSDSSDLDHAVTAQFHRIIDQQVDHMQGIIRDLLDVAHINTGTLSIYPEPVDVAEIVDGARNRSPNAGVRERLQVDLPPNLPPVMADRRRISQVLINLLSNAAANAPDGSLIQVTAVRDGIYLAVSVSDQGRGIPEDSMPFLFRKFSRIDNFLDIDHTGSGLGLAICKGIVEAHGGRIWAESDGPGQGAQFTFLIPVAEQNTVSSSPIAFPSSQDTPPNKLRILAVDDDPHALRYVRDIIAKAGYTPIVTGDHSDVHNLIDEAKPHLVLLDLMLGAANGIELMNDIHKQSDVPVIFVSAYGQENVVARAFDMGASDYVVKPFSPTELTARIAAALRRRAAPDVPEPAQPYQAGDLAIDYPRRRVSVDGHPVELTPTEYALLYELSVHAGRPLTHDHLLQRVWGPERKGEPWLVREVVKRLRHKLDDDAKNPVYILTEPRVGYSMPENSKAQPG
ncbi:MAG: response regulator [Chloroflexi bacterium]|nr:response regulator [Chloroflexota bacterium]MYD48264.1 response regulator [Chloroflexota bacterium]